jgi:hypothetical protein
MFVLSEYRTISIHHGISAKQQTLYVNGYNRVKIPEDATLALGVYIKEGERILPLVKDRSLNNLYNFDESGSKIPHPDAINSDIVSHENSEEYLYRYGTTSFGGFFGLNASQDRAMNIDYENGEIVFSNQFDKDVVVITYEVNNISCTSANLVRYEFIDVLKSKAKLEMLPFIGSTAYELLEAKTSYKNAKRNMRALLEGLSKADFIAAIRKGIHGSTKN